MPPGPLCPGAVLAIPQLRLSPAEGLPSKGCFLALCVPHLARRRLGEGGRRPGTSASREVFLDGCSVSPPCPAPPATSWASPTKLVGVTADTSPPCFGLCVLSSPHYVVSVSNTACGFVFLQDGDWYSRSSSVPLSKDKCYSNKAPVTRHRLCISAHLMGTHIGAARPEGTARASCALKRGPWGKVTQ